MAATHPTPTPIPIPIFLLVMSPETDAELVRLLVSPPLLPPFDGVDDAEAPGTDNVLERAVCEAAAACGLVVTTLVVTGLLGSMTLGWFPGDVEGEPSFPAEEVSG